MGVIGDYSSWGKVYRTLDADVTIGCYYGDYNSCDNTIPMPLFIWNKFFRSHLRNIGFGIDMVIHSSSYCFVRYPLILPCYFLSRKEDIMSGESEKQFICIEEPEIMNPLGNGVVCKSELFVTLKTSKL